MTLQLYLMTDLHFYEKKIPAVPSYEFNRHLSSHHANNPTTTMKINFDNVLKNMVDFINKSANECVCEKRAM